MTDTNESSEFSPIESQGELDRIVSKRVERERAKFSDYDDLKASAGELPKLRETHEAAIAEVTKAKETADAEVARLTAEVSRLGIASEKGVPAKLLTGETEEELKASADALLAFRGEGQAGHGNTDTYGPLGGLEGVDGIATRDVEARTIFGL